MKIKIEQVIEDLDHGFKKALERTYLELPSNQPLDRNALFNIFCRAISKEFNTWEEIKDDNVQR